MRPCSIKVSGQAGSTHKLLPVVTLVVLVCALAVLGLFHPSLVPGSPQGATDNSELLVLGGSTMGTRYRLLFHHDAFSPALQQDVQTKVSTRLAVLDQQLFSTYSPQSQLSQLNAQPIGEPMLVSSEMMTVLASASEVSRLSGGAFDITVKSLVDLWGFGAANTVLAIPDQEAISSALATTGMQKIALAPANGTVTRLSEVSMDLSAIAKGYAVDDMARLLDSLLVEHYLVEIGGEIRTRGSRPDGLPWQVGIEAPDAAGVSLFQALHTGNQPLAVAASGNYRHFFSVDGVRYSHTINPQTGWPVTHDLASVTVIADSTMLADAWATALAVLGHEAGMKLANELQLAAYFIVTGSSGFNTYHSESFKQYL